MLQLRTKHINRFSYIILTPFIPSSNDYYSYYNLQPNVPLVLLTLEVLEMKKSTILSHFHHL